MLRIEITIVVIQQPPRSGRFSIPDSGQNPCSQRRSVPNTEMPLNNGHQETTPLKLYPTRTRARTAAPTRTYVRTYASQNNTRARKI